MLGDGGAEQAEALGGGQALLHRRNQAVVEGRGAKGQGEIAGQAEAAELRAAAHHLHHVDRGPGGLRRDHGGVAEGVAAPGLLGHRGGDARLDRLDRQQLALAAVAGRIERRHIHARNLGQGPQALLARGVPVGGDGLDKGRQQQLAIAEQEHIKKGRQRLGIGREHGPAAKHDRIGLAPLLRPDRDALLLQQVKQHGPIQLPAQGEAKQIQARTATAQLAIAAAIPLAMGRVRLVGEQAPHVHIGPLGQGCPHHLVAQAGDPHRIGAGKGQHRAQGPCLRLGWIKQQGFLVQGGVALLEQFSLEGGGHGGALWRRRELGCGWSDISYGLASGSSTSWSEAWEPAAYRSGLAQATGHSPCAIPTRSTVDRMGYANLQNVRSDSHRGFAAREPRPPWRVCRHELGFPLKRIGRTKPHGRHSYR